MRRLQAQRHRSNELKQIENFKRENVYPMFTLRHASWKEENIAELKKKQVYPKFTQGHTGYKPRLPPSFTKHEHMDWKRRPKKSYLDKIAFAEGRLEKQKELSS